MSDLPLDLPPNPLAEAEPLSLDELFDRDPLELTKQNIDQIILAFRNQRKTWEAEETAAKVTGRKPSSRISQEQAKNLTLESLQISL